jgi:streptogramin lyase
MIQIPRVDRIRLDDYAAAPDGGVWTAGSAVSTTGQQSYFLAYIASGATDIRIIQTNPYHPRQLSVAPDGTVWTAGYAVMPDGKGGNRQDGNQDSLRHFDASGNLIASAMPAGSVGPLRAAVGFLVANQDRIGWYSPAYGNGAYVELSPDMNVLRSYPVAHTPDKSSRTEGLVVTPSGRVFATVMHTGPRRPSSALYELDRSANDWVAVEAPQDTKGNVPWLEGNDAESLVFTGPRDKSKLQVFELSQVASPR